MLSFKALSEKKTKVTLNPKLKDVMEKKGCSKCEDTCGKDCKCSCHDKEMDEAKVYDPMEDDTFDHDEAEATRGQSGKNKSITIKKKTKKTTKEEMAYVSQEEVSEESNQESETETLLTFKQFNEGRAEDAKKSLDAVKKRQKVLDAHEKKTGKKLDITKTPEHKQHKMRFPGAKRTGKKVKGAKETELQQHNRRVTKHNERLIKKGPTTKEKAKQAGYDAYEKKHKRGNKSVWD